MGRVKLVFWQDLSGSPVENELENNENERKTRERTRPEKEKSFKDPLQMDIRVMAY